MNKEEMKDRSLPEVAKHFLEQQGDFETEIIGSYNCSSGRELPLYKYLLSDGKVATEYVQFVIPGSGSSYLLGLKTVDTDMGWVKKPWMQVF